jgi:hypothetical protein
LEPRNDEPRKESEPRKEEKERKRRFQIVKLEERIVPSNGWIGGPSHGRHGCSHDH